MCWWYASQWGKERSHWLQYAILDDEVPVEMRRFLRWKMLMLCIWLGYREEMAKEEFRSSIAGSRRKFTVPESMISVFVGCDPAAAPCCLV